MATVHRLRLPNSTVGCLEKLTHHAKKGTIAGIAFVCMMEGDAYIADTCGTASDDPQKTILLLQALEAKIVKRSLRSRR